MSPREIIATWLRSNGYDGLACDGCGCGLDDMMPCDALDNECRPAMKHRCDGACGFGCEMENGGDCFRAIPEADDFAARLELKLAASRLRLRTGIELHADRALCGIRFASRVAILSIRHDYGAHHA